MKTPLSLLLVVLVRLAIPVDAQTAKRLPPEVQATFDQGMAAAKRGEWETAIRCFEQSRKNASDVPEQWSGLLFNQGLAEAQIPGRELRAAVLFRAYLAAVSNAPNADAVRKQVTALEVKAKANILELIKQTKQLVVELPDGLFDYDRLTHPGKVRKKEFLVELVALRGAAGDIEGARAAATAYTSRYVNEWEPQRALAERLAPMGKLAEAQSFASSIPDGYVCAQAALRAIGIHQAEFGDIAGARATWKRLAGIDSYAHEVGLSICKAQLRADDIAGAKKSVFELYHSSYGTLAKEYCAILVQAEDVDAAKRFVLSLSSEWKRDELLKFIAKSQVLEPGEMRLSREQLKSYTYEEAIRDQWQSQLWANRMAVQDTTNEPYAPPFEEWRKQYLLKERVTPWTNLLEPNHGRLHEPFFTDLPAFLKSVSTENRGEEMIDKMLNALREMTWALHGFRKVR